MVICDRCLKKKAIISGDTQKIKFANKYQWEHYTNHFQYESVLCEKCIGELKGLLNKFFGENQ